MIAFASHAVNSKTQTLYLADADGKNPRPLTQSENYHDHPAWSPDGKIISFDSWNSIGMRPAELQTIDINTKEGTSLSIENVGRLVRSSWSPNGKQIAFDAWTDYGYQIFIANTDGTDSDPIAKGYAPNWSPDGRYIVFVSNRDGDDDIFVMESDGGNQHALTYNSDWETSPVWSPDGQQIAFASNSESGSRHVFVMDRNGEGVSDLTSDSDIRAYSLSWSPENDQIIFDAIQYNTASQLESDLTARLRIEIIISTIALASVFFLANRRFRSRIPSMQKSNDVNDALKKLEIIRNPILKWVFRIFPWVLLFTALMGITPAFNLYPPVLRYFLNSNLLYYSGVATAAISFLAFQILMQRVPEAFRILWNRRAIAGVTTFVNESSPVDNPSGANAEVAGKFRDYIDNLSRLINDPRQVIVGVICGIVGASWIFYNLDPSDLISASTWIIHPKFIVQFIIGFSIGYVAGLQIWRMIVIGVGIRRLGNEFDLALQLGHPDGCEGLAPLGNICLWNALVASPAGIDLSAWLILGNYYQGLFYFILVIVVAVASISFFVPLWNVHKIMVAKRDAIRQQLDQLGQNINRLTRELLERADELDPVESEKIARKREMIQKTYQDGQHIAVWPFDTRTLAKFVTSQIVPLLSITGLGEPIKEIIIRLVDWSK